MLLRRVGLSGLDPALFDRPKSGFVLPFDRWIRTKLGKVMDQLMRDPAAAAGVSLNSVAVSRLWDTFQSGGAGMYWSRVWSIYILMRWCQRHQVTM
jgi:asparagine synthase (glutamine-hydrolysing)